MSKDDIRRSLCYNKDYDSCDLFLVEEVRDAMLRACLERNYDVVMDETFIEIADMNRALRQLRTTDRAILFDLSNVSPRVCIKRNRHRTYPVREGVIEAAYRRLRENDKRFDELIRPFDEVYDGRKGLNQCDFDIR